MSVAAVLVRGFTEAVKTELFGVSNIELIKKLIINTVKLGSRQRRKKLPAEIQTLFNRTVFAVALTDKVLFKQLAEFDIFFALSHTPRKAD